MAGLPVSPVNAYLHRMTRGQRDLLDLRCIELSSARSSDPTKKREQSLQRELTRVGKSIERLLTAYQEGLLSLEQLRERMPLLRQREQSLRAELQAIADQAADRATFLRLAETLTTFLGREDYLSVCTESQASSIQQSVSLIQ